MVMNHLPKRTPEISSPKVLAYTASCAGLLHLANALDKPVVGIYTDTDPLKTGVQVSPWAKNLGDVAQIPAVEEVYNVLMECVAAKNNHQAV